MAMLSRPGFLVLAFASAFLACCGIGAREMKAYQGPELGDSEVAVFNHSDWGSLRSLREQGSTDYAYALSRDGGRAPIKLQPGVYDVSYAQESYGPVSSTFASGHATIELKAGHAYRVRSSASFFSIFHFGSYEPRLWVEDTTTGEVFTGDKP